jgi:hypothetical protein
MAACFDALEGCEEVGRGDLGDGVAADIGKQEVFEPAEFLGEGLRCQPRAL